MNWIFEILIFTQSFLIQTSYSSIALNEISSPKPVESCQVELYHNIFKVAENVPIQIEDFVKETDCPTDLQFRLVQILNKMNGTINIQTLLEELAQVQDRNMFTQVNIVNKKIFIGNLGEYIKNYIKQENTFVFSDLRIMNGRNSLSLLEDEELDLTNRLEVIPGERSLKLFISHKKNSTKRYVWVTAKVYMKINVLKSKTSLSPSNSSLTASNFFQDEILTMNPENYLTDISKIAFFRVNKNILPNSVIYNHDLQPINLINYGTPVNVILNTQHISLQKSMMPTRSAKLNETVELRGPQNKIISGKVIDFNKAVINL